MHVLRHTHEVSAFIQTHPDPTITTLIQQRLAELLADDDTTMEELVFFVVLEPQDTPAQLATLLNHSQQASPLLPPWEVIEEHPACFEMVFVLSSSGYGALVFAPKHDTHPDLLALCQIHAIPAQEHPTP